MNGIGAIDLIGGLLQLAIPSYGLRLVRRFGVQRVGWFLVAAFVSLSALYLVGSPRLPHDWTSQGQHLDWAMALAAGLLVVGLGHLETLLTERQGAQREAQNLEQRIQAAVTERTADLSYEIEKLRQELGRCERQEKALKSSEAQYRFLFTEHPLPMLLFNPATLECLAGNHAAGLQYRIPMEEFRTLTLRDVVTTEETENFLQAFSGPRSGSTARSVWEQRRGDLSVFRAEITLADMKFGGRPARLMIAVPTNQRPQTAPDLQEDQRIELIRGERPEPAPPIGTLVCIAPAHVGPPAQEAPCCDAIVHGSVLLVEPDDRIRCMARFALQRNGYHVIEADCAETVLHVWGGQSAKVGLLVVDEALPGTPNGELAQKLIATKPELRILVTTTATGSIRTFPASNLAKAATLPKPYNAEQLVRAVGATWEATPS
jgi:CheY-like chemotaxis protein